MLYMCMWRSNDRLHIIYNRRKNYKYKLQRYQMIELTNILVLHRDFQQYEIDLSFLWFFFFCFPLDMQDLYNSVYLLLVRLEKSQLGLQRTVSPVECVSLVSFPPNRDGFPRCYLQMGQICRIEITFNVCSTIL